MTLDAFRQWLQRQGASHKSQREWALQLGLSPQYLNDVLHGHRGPGKKLLDAVGFQCTKDYQPTKGSA